LPSSKTGDRAAGASAGRWRPKTRDGLALSAAAACSALDARTAREGAATKRPLIQGSPQPRRLLSLQGKSSVPLRLRHTFGVGRSLVTACRNFVATFKEDSLRICDTRYRLDRPPAEKPAALLLTVPYRSWRSRRNPPAQPSSETVKPTPELVSRLNH